MNCIWFLLWPYVIACKVLTLNSEVLTSHHLVFIFQQHEACAKWQYFHLMTSSWFPLSAACVYQPVWVCMCIETEIRWPQFSRRHIQMHFFNENYSTSIKISLSFAPKRPIVNIPTLVQIMAWRRPGDKPLSEPMMVNTSSRGLNGLLSPGE